MAFSYLFSVIVMNNQFDLTRIPFFFQDPSLVFAHFLYALTLAVTIIVVSVPGRFAHDDYLGVVFKYET